jgi:hypothetical protein
VLGGALDQGVSRATPPFTGDSYAGKGPFNDALKRQSKLNADAAKCAAMAAALQSMALLVRIFG